MQKLYTQKIKLIYVVCLRRKKKKKGLHRMRITPAMAASVAFFVLATALFLDHAYAKSTGLEPEEIVTAPGFSYSGDTGPDKWGRLRPDYAACSNGKLQSPINIEKDKVVLNKNLKPLRREYYPANATLVDRGYNVGMQFGNAGVLIVDGKNYTLQQMHWHSPSEHKIDGASSDAELHLVHRAIDGNISVVAILYKIDGVYDPIIAKIQSKLSELAKEVSARHELAQLPVGTFNACKLRRNTHKYYRYVGSLTTPPCSENVIWHILGKVRSISKEQVEALKAPLQSTCKSNCRPEQPLNGRQVQLFNELN